MYIPQDYNNVKMYVNSCHFCVAKTQIGPRKLCALQGKESGWMAGIFVSSLCEVQLTTNTNS